ncbi:hypothetical protein CEXT_67491 [Caerostris extrusa]|uniref:Uncharacterized protein n=1 Tax=Caerostris extrusa TaxID=172846 RepID=A0AAV4XQF3_CAEEX|nr:hypothetical protein CEXT_67491 [Caerostris extrusa]
MGCVFHSYCEKDGGRKRRSSADDGVMDDCMAAMVLMSLSCSPKSPCLPPLQGRSPLSLVAERVIHPEFRGRRRVRLSGSSTKEIGELIGRSLGDFFGCLTGKRDGDSLPAVTDGDLEEV